jgi:hypothetical protein
MRRGPAGLLPFGSSFVFEEGRELRVNSLGGRVSAARMMTNVSLLEPSPPSTTGAMVRRRGDVSVA